MTQQFDPRYFQQALQQLNAKIDGVAGSARRDLQAAVGALQVRRHPAVRSLEGLGNEAGGGIWHNVQAGVLRLEDIPGRRRPFIYTVEIPIGVNLTSQVSQSFTISQDGPFIATRRMCTFLSLHSFAYTDPQTNAQVTFNGRSNGRFRPITSACDIVDSQHHVRADTGYWLYNSLAANKTQNIPLGMQSMISDMSSFRTMEFDGYIELKNTGSALARQNRPIPTTFWTSQCCAGVELGALDFFERGEAVEVTVQPTHPNNPPYGNVNDGNVWVLSTGFPFLDGQYDVHEGIVTPGAINTVANNPTVFLSADPITRLPEGILIVALEGYRIDQPPGIPAGVQL